MSTPTRRFLPLGRLALTLGLVGVASIALSAALNWWTFRPTGTVRYSTEPPIDWFTITFAVTPVMVTGGLVAIAAGLVITLVAIVRSVRQTRARAGGRA